MAQPDTFKPWVWAVFAFNTLFNGIFAILCFATFSVSPSCNFTIVSNHVHTTDHSFSDSFHHVLRLYNRMLHIYQ